MKWKDELDPRALARSLRRNAWPLSIGLVLGALIFGVQWGGSERGAEPHGDHTGHARESDAAATWTCAMHPQIRKTEPGSCPICGMDLVPVQEGTSPEIGSARVQLSARASKLAQLRTTAVVRQRDAAEEVRLLGRIAPNEQTLRNITAWIGGRVDRLFVNTTGERVHAGQRVASLYSPEVYTAHQDLITATRQLERLQDGSDSARNAARAALNAARQRLSLLGVPDDELTRMQKDDKPSTSVAIRSPFSGTVLERFITEGSYISTGARLYSVANLKSLWIELDAYESDLPLLSEGQKVSVEVEAFPGENFVGEVTFIDPTLNPRLRTAKVRVEIDNDDRRLRPGMFAQAVVTAHGLDGKRKDPEGEPLVIPASAPLFTGRRAIVYVEVTGGEGLIYEARTVRLGPRLGDNYPVVAGLAEGERVVTRGAFALDADLQIKGGQSMMMSPDDSEPGLWDDVIHVPKTQLRPLRDVMNHYLAIQKALASDDFGAAKESTVELRAILPTVELAASPAVAQTWQHVEGMLAGGATHIAQAESIEQARKGFEHLSGAIIMMLRTFGNPLDEQLSLAHCPMARGSEGANWIQQGTAIENSYFGKSMRTCGDVQEHVGPGAHLTPPDAKDPSTVSPREGHAH